MKTIRFYALLVLTLTFIFGTTSCFEEQDNLVPLPSASVSNTNQITGQWKVYALVGGTLDQPYKGVSHDAAVTLHSDGTLVIRRRGIDYNGTWQIDKATRGYLTIDMDVEDNGTIIPKKWAITHLEGNEFWVATGAKRVKMRKM
ncbi:lipocalin-like domain-containing protein [Hugenholtzia roseola]|uniref:lipocalin-like domain-containing protein n=1 Tax=Hugenholtzia roseola TaxID=1002 RepID=UPI00041DAFB2|nr:glycoside hydrolase family 43 C-terminal domain-containing protein [Hugenholtzia roseola]